MNDDIFGHFWRSLTSKFSRWDAVSIAIFMGLVYAAVQGFKVTGGTFTQLLILIIFLFTVAFLGFFVEYLLKRLI